MRHFVSAVARAALWSAVILVFVVGATRFLSVFFGGSDNSAGATTQVVPQAPTWPDSAARNLAVQFARDYWTRDPDHANRYTTAINSYTTDSLATQIVPTWPRAMRLSAAAPTVADEHVIPGGKTRALITVSAKVTENHAAPRTMYLAVPVEKDKSGALVVFDYPSLAAGPTRGNDEGDTLQPLPTGEQVEIDGTLTQFFTAYLAGDTAGLEYFTLPGIHLQALSTPLRLREVGAISLTEAPAGKVRELAVNVTATTTGDQKYGDTPVSFPLRYRLRMERGDRWYIASINQGGS